MQYVFRSVPVASIPLAYGEQSRSVALVNLVLSDYQISTRLYNGAYGTILHEFSAKIIKKPFLFNQ